MSAGVVVNQTQGSGGAHGKSYCSKPHPSDESVWCRRQPHGRDRNHAAFVFKISEPEEWEWDS